MDDPFGNALAVESGQLLDEVLVLQQYRPTGTGSLRVLVVGDGGAGFCREDSSLGIVNLLRCRVELQPFDGTLDRVPRR